MLKKIRTNPMILAVARVDLFVYSCGWLMVLLVLGTLAQPKMGLYQSQVIYFSSWFFELGGFPLPGARLVLSIMFFNLLAFMLKHKWNLKKSGIFLAHSGALLLLLGGFITAHFSQEGSMIIEEGQSSNYVADYHRLEFVMLLDGKEFRFSQGLLKQGFILKHPKIPYEMVVQNFYENCLAKNTPEEARLVKSPYVLEGLERLAKESENRTGLVLDIQDKNGKVLARYHLWEEEEKLQKFEKFELTLRKERRYLPFSLELLDFRMETHPGTQMASAYQSEVNLVKDQQKRRILIEMNQPMREGKYTFFQSSYYSPGHGKPDVTILAVVENYGRLFPYISSLIMCLGLCIHLLIFLPAQLLKTQGGSK